MSNDKNQVILFGDSLPWQSRPLGIYVLASYLRGHGIPTQTVWGWTQLPYKTFYILCQKFLHKDLRVVGISSTLLSYANPNNRNFFGLEHEELQRRLSLIKKLAPNAKIVVGGCQTIHKNLSSVPGSEFVDLYVQGQGEEALLEIVNAGNKKIITSNIIPPITTDKIYPYNNFATTVTTIDPSDCWVHGESMGIEFARGCVFRCSFCSYELTGKLPGDYTKSKEALTQELIHNYENYGITHYYSTDDLINDSEEKVDMILDVSRRLPFKLTYTGYLRLDLIWRFPDSAKKLKDSGLVGGFMGIETINDASGKAVRKGLGIRRINEAIDICNQAWQNTIAIHGSFILGLPSDTPECKHQLLEWLNSRPVRSVIKNVNVEPLIISRAGLSDIDQNPEQFGYSDTGIQNITKYGPDFMSWTNKNYCFDQALSDANFVKKEFYSTKKFPNSVGTFQLPYVLSLSKCPEEVMNVVLNDRSSEWATNVEFENYLHNLINDHKNKYINQLLLGVK